MHGLMQDYDLTVDKIIDHAALWHGAAEVVSADLDGRITRAGYAEVRARSRRLSGALASLGLGFGDRVGTLAWNTRHHLEAWYALMGSGLVCHTLNPRLSPEHLAAMVEQAGDRALFVGAGQADQALDLARRCPGLRTLVFMDDAPPPAPGDAPPRVELWAFEALLEARGRNASWGGFDERTAAGLCYTSGTTGAPKGVLYSHRSNWLLTLRTLAAEAVALKEEDVVLLATPMFHANGWGLPFAAPAVGARLVLPGRRLDGASLARLIAAEQVSVAVGVQTVWQGLLDHLDAEGGGTPSLRRVLLGGASAPAALIERLRTRLDAEVQTSWGMTELSPFGTITPPGAAPDRTRTSGRAPLGLEMRLTDAENRVLPEQRCVVGHLKVKGPSVAAGYLGAPANALDADGFFDTGDLARIDVDGYLSIAGRSKDLIKSGGEWINPAEIEDIMGASPLVSQVAVIGRPDERWGERPILVVQPAPGRPFDADALLDVLRGRVPDWWLPERTVEVAAMPLASTGKIDKVRLRADHAAQ